MDKNDVKELHEEIVHRDFGCLRKLTLFFQRLADAAGTREYSCGVFTGQAFLDKRSLTENNIVRLHVPNSVEERNSI